ncbi:MAG TPA: hypothetical protein VFB80_04620 [Pirellulaceae bacterium]|nr:hypothetical protein [Pirellulaceae bacterium]
MSPHSMIAACLCGTLFAAAAWAGDIDRDPPPQESLQLVLDRIHTHAGGAAWKERNWTDAAIEGWIDKLLKQLGEATGKELKAPVRLKDVKPAGDTDQLLRGHLKIGKHVKQSSVYDSIVLADGNAELSTVKNSIVIARSVATTSSVENSLIIAGRYFRCSSDRVVNANPTSSILISRGHGEITIARGTIICAPLGIEVSLAENVTFVNCKVNRALNQQNVQMVNGKPLPLGEPPVSALEKQLELLGYMPSPPGALFRFQGRRLFAEKDQPIVDELGAPVKELAGWSLSHVDLRMALFTSGEQEACLIRAR